jgi:hypothetical protein
MQAPASPGSLRVLCVLTRLGLLPGRPGLHPPCSQVPPGAHLCPQGAALGPMCPRCDRAAVNRHLMLSCPIRYVSYPLLPSTISKPFPFGSNSRQLAGG